MRRNERCGGLAGPGFSCKDREKALRDRNENAENGIPVIRTRCPERFHQMFGKLSAFERGRLDGGDSGSAAPKRFVNGFALPIRRCTLKLRSDHAVESMTAGILHGGAQLLVERRYFCAVAFRTGFFCLGFLHQPIAHFDDVGAFRDVPERCLRLGD